jgi:hypothetical protein
MSRRLLSFENVIVAGLVILGGLVGVLVLQAPERTPAPPPGLTPADSVLIAAQYEQQLTLRPPAHVGPAWLKDVHIARLQQRATLDRQRPDSIMIPRDSVIAVLAAAGDSYLESMLAEDQGLVSRWRTPGEPIRVWVQSRSSERGFSSELVSPARRGFTVWNDVDIGTHFELVDDSTVADVHVTWRSTMARRDQLGTTFRITNAKWWIVLAHVVLSSARDIHTVQNAVRHEAGHVLGLGHSPNASDIMAAATEGRQVHLTNADARTAALLYRLPPGKLSR